MRSTLTATFSLTFSNHWVREYSVRSSDTGHCQFVRNVHHWHHWWLVRSAVRQHLWSTTAAVHWLQSVPMLLMRCMFVCVTFVCVCVCTSLCVRVCSICVCVCVSPMCVCVSPVSVYVCVYHLCVCVCVCVCVSLCVCVHARSRHVVNSDSEFYLW